MIEPILQAVLLSYMAAVAQVNHIDPVKFRALCTVESRPTRGGELEMRVGRLGKSPFYGPGGVNEQCFKDKDMVKNPYSNLFFAGQALAKHGARTSKGSWVKALLAYNTEATPAYIWEVFRIAAKIRRQGE